MSDFTFILNPKAGKGKAAKLTERLHAAIKAQPLGSFEIVETSGIGDATKIAKASSSPIVVAVGGDGTVHEVANGIIGTEKILGIVPAGSGNDFIKSVLIPPQLRESVACLARRRVACVDVGKVKLACANGTAAEDQSASFFVNGLGIGFDAAVADRTRHISIASGTLVYVIAVLQTLGRYRAPMFDITIDGKTSHSKNLLIAIGNGKCAGGGFYLTPDAKVTDGVLDVCLINEIPTFEILKLMPKVMKGRHRDCRHVRLDRAKEIRVVADGPVAVHSDGEILASDATELDVKIVPGALKVITGGEL